ncbi:MAG: ATP-binding protein [Deltaproteobacteria bacterium]|nr:ATP-binding protein [Deltaproteobacteria bacterium]
MAIPATITLPARLDSLYNFMDFVSSCAREQGFSNERISEIELALEEVLVNIFNYAYKDSGLNGNVEINCKLADTQSFVIEIADTGVPFDILSVREPDVSAEIDKRPIGGLGVYFVKRLMDDIKYKREAGKNILTLMVRKTEHKS